MNSFETKISGGKIIMGLFYEKYKVLETNLREECDQMVEDGELTQEEADFRFWMVRDEILENIQE